MRYASERCLGQTRAQNPFELRAGHCESKSVIAARGRLRRPEHRYMSARMPGVTHNSFAEEEKMTSRTQSRLALAASFGLGLGALATHASAQILYDPFSYANNAVLDSGSNFSTSGTSWNARGS